MVCKKNSFRSIIPSEQRWMEFLRLLFEMWWPYFGGGEIIIFDNSNTSKNSNSELYTYQLPENTGINEDEYLAGALHFKVTKMEVFRIQWLNI